MSLTFVPFFKQGWNTMNRKYSSERRERALRMRAETRLSHPTMMGAVRHVAGLLGMSPETLRLWQRRYEVPVLRVPLDDDVLVPRSTRDA
ncbi:hypothetical protein AB2L57_09380 [Microbacterium sp. HA-8]|uniref:hypothetical protein n=1 Tax=Microbacterium sp. HA-8 TaxID=3234200 RepID=UPI0038F6EAB9